MSGPKIICWVLWTGTRTTLRRLGEWQSASDLEGAQRASGVVLRAFGTLTVLWFVGGVLWALGALWYAVPMTWFTSAAILGGDTDEILGDDGDEDAPELPVVEALHALLGDKNGVHLSQVAEHLNVDQRSVRGFLDERGVTCKSVKILGSVAVGVHRDDMPPLPSPALGSGEGVGVVPGQRATATATYEIHKTAEGLQAWFQDPLNPVRTHIVQLGNRETS
jgi:hypothetical protein